MLGMTKLIEQHRGTIGTFWSFLLESHILSSVKFDHRLGGYNVINFRRWHICLMTITQRVWMERPLRKLGICGFALRSPLAINGVASFLTWEKCTTSLSYPHHGVGLTKSYQMISSWSNLCWPGAWSRTGSETWWQVTARTILCNGLWGRLWFTKIRFMVCAENLRVYVWMESLLYDAVAQRAVYHVLHRFLNHITMCMSISCQQADALGDSDLLMAPNDGACIQKNPT